MAYNKSSWDNGDIITKSKMNNIENGISDAHTEIASLKNNISSSTGITAEQSSQLSTAYQHSKSIHAPSNAEANVQADWNEADTSSDAYIQNKPTNLATIDDIPAVPTKTSQLENDSNFVTDSVVDEKIANAQLGSGGEVDLSGYAKTTDIPTKTSQLTNDSGYITSIPDEYITESELNAKNYATEQYVDDVVHNASISSAYTHPATHPASMITGLSTVATTGSYNDLTDKPIIPIRTSQLSNDSDFVDSAFVSRKIADASLSGGEVDLSGYVTKETGNANQIIFSDGETFQTKLDSGALKGDKGDPGEKGADGAQGPKGDKGDPGEQGPQGIQGLKGDKGDKGDTGEQGPAGANGQDGLTTAISVNGNTYTHVNGVITLPNYPTTSGGTGTDDVATDEEVSTALNSIFGGVN